MLLALLRVQPSLRPRFRLLLLRYRRAADLHCQAIPLRPVRDRRYNGLLRGPTHAGIDLGESPRTSNCHIEAVPSLSGSSCSARTPRLCESPLNRSSAASRVATCHRCAEGRGARSLAVLVSGRTTTRMLRPRVPFALFANPDHESIGHPVRRLRAGSPPTPLHWRLLRLEDPREVARVQVCRRRATWADVSDPLLVLGAGVSERIFARSLSPTTALALFRRGAWKSACSDPTDFAEMDSGMDAW